VRARGRINSVVARRASETLRMVVQMARAREEREAAKAQKRGKGAAAA
jgi:hypothetical protein